MVISGFSKLLEPIEIGPMAVKNRVMLPAMATCFATADCFVTDQMIRYYANRASVTGGFKGSSGGYGCI